jgi:activator of HSP90 ATPase
VQEWYSNNRQWEKPSLVTFTLNQEKDKVRIELLHIDVPDADAESIKEGWKEYYLGPLKEYLEENKKV